MGEGNILLMECCQLSHFILILFDKYRNFLLTLQEVIYYWKSFSLTAVNSYAGASQARVVPSTSYTPNRHKRSYEEDEEMDTQTQQNEEISGKKFFFLLPCVDFDQNCLTNVGMFVFVFFPLPNVLRLVRWMLYIRQN